MAEFKLDGRMKVKTLKDNFKRTSALHSVSTRAQHAAAPSPMTMQLSHLSEQKAKQAENSLLAATSKSATSRRKLLKCTASAYRWPIPTTPNSRTTT